MRADQDQLTTRLPRCCSHKHLHRPMFATSAANPRISSSRLLRQAVVRCAGPVRERYRTTLPPDVRAHPAAVLPSNTATSRAWRGSTASGWCSPATSPSASRTIGTAERGAKLLLHCRCVTCFCWRCFDRSMRRSLFSPVLLAAEFGWLVCPQLMRPSMVGGPAHPSPRYAPSLP